MQIKTKNRILWLDLLRCFSIYAMMLLHVSASYIGKVEKTYLWEVNNTYRTISMFCVPVFVMISGIFFLDSSRQVTLKTIYKKNCPRIISAFIFWSLLYAIYTELDNMSTGGGFRNQAFIYNFIAGNYHLWFLFMLIGLYIITPLLRKITADKKMTEYFILLSFIFCFGVNMLKLITPLSKYIDIILNKTFMYFVLGYTGYYLLGYYLYNYDIKKKYRYIIYVLGLVSVIIVVLLTSIDSNSTGIYMGKYNSYLLPFALCESVSIFLIFKYGVSKIKFKDKFRNVIYLVSAMSFGMYLVHDFFLKLFGKIGFSTKLYNPLFSVPINALLVFILSFVLVWVISKIPKLNKWII